MIAQEKVIMKASRNQREADRYRVHKDAINAKRRQHKDVPGRGTWNRMNPDHFDFGASLRKPPGESSFARLVRQYKASAKRRGMRFELTDHEIRALSSSDCFYCGIPPAQLISSKDSNGAYVYNGIDRTDPDIGYVSTNCVAACKMCNRSKSNMKPEAWMEWIERVHNHKINNNI